MDAFEAEQRMLEALAEESDIDDYASDDDEQSEQPSLNNLNNDRDNDASSEEEEDFAPEIYEEAAGFSILKNQAVTTSSSSPIGCHNTCLEDCSVPEVTIQEQLSFTNKKDIKWCKMGSGITRTLPFQQTTTGKTISDVRTPFQYLSQYLSAEFFQNTAKYTNLYADQKGNSFVHCDGHEMQQLFGLHVLIAVLKYPRLTMFWSKGVGHHLFYDHMSKNRFLQLRNNLHLLDCNKRPSGNVDKFFKVRPIIDAVRAKILEAPLEKDLSIDEQMIPFKGKLSVKQYIKGKPTPWGVKQFVLAGKSGRPYDFIVYQGSTTELSKDHLEQLGFGASIVLHLANRIPKGDKGHELYFDNFFSTFPLFEILKDRDILAAGTIRLNRFKEPPFPTDKDMKSKGRGSSSQFISHNKKVMVTKWYDNKAVHLASNFMGIGKEDTVQR